MQKSNLLVPYAVDEAAASEPKTAAGGSSK
jgi:hypothetical protein